MSARVPFTYEGEACPLAELTAIIGPSMTNHYGQRLRETRLRAGFLTQTALAEKLGVNKKTISRHEASPTPPNPTDRVVQGLLRVLREDEDYLIRGVRRGATIPRGNGSGAVAKVGQYLASQTDGTSVSTETARRLLSLPWAELQIPDPTPEQIHVMRLALDELSRL